MERTYHLGIDLGTTYTAAAIARDDRVQVVGLGNRASSIPSLIYLREDETILTAEAAERRAATEPGRIAREFKRRVGDPTPLLLGGSPYSAEALTSKLLRWVVDKVAELEGGPAGQLAITHPANWGPYKQDLLRQAIRLADLPGAVTLTEPQAAAISYAANERVEPGSLIAVYDLGGGTFDAAVLRKTPDGFDILGEPEGIERLGGIDLDEAVFAHVRRSIGDALDALDIDDPTSIAALARLRSECVAAKEALSADTEASIPVLLPTIQTEVRLTRGEFEQLVRPPLTDTVAAMRRALASAEADSADVAAVLLVGGSSRIPLVAALISDAFGRPIAVDAHPKHAIALGAAHAAALEADRARPTPADVVPVAVAAPPVPDDLAGVATLTPAVASSVTTERSPAGSEPEPDATTPMDVAAQDPRTEGPMASTSTARGPSGSPGSDGGPPIDPPPSAPGQPFGGGADPEPAAGEGARSRGPLVIVGAVVALLVIGGAVFALTGSDDGSDEVPVADADHDHEAVAEEETIDEPEEVVEEDPEPDEPPATADDIAPIAEADEPEIPPGVDFATIDEIDLDGDTYIVEFATYEFEAELPGMHVHFFFDTVEPEQAGVPGEGPWFVYGDASPFTEWGVADRPTGATELCVLVANPDHSVQPESGTCLELP
jgi:molecular chaperone DnaK